MTATFSDEREREQIRTEHDRTLFVVAGAGTGKTTALVSRIVALVAAGHTDLSDLAAITFTEAAAGELRDRVRTALERAARGEDPLIVSDTERTRCRTARDRVDDGALCTLHAFAQRILATAPLHAGIPPRFAVVDEIEAAINFDRRWSDFLDELLSLPELEPTLTQALVLDITLAHWRSIATSLHAQWDRVPRPEGIHNSQLPAIDCTELVRALDAVAALREHCRDPDDKLLERINIVATTRDYILAERDHGDLDLLTALIVAPIPTFAYGKQPMWAIPKPEIKAAFDALHAARDRLFEERAAAIFAIVTPHVFAWCRSGARERANSGLLEFHDLLVLARDLLRASAGVRHTIAQRYRYLLIDEFQDTDPLQIELAMLLATDRADDDTIADSWSEMTVEPGRLFFVGDPKQSIYRFRRADLDLYARAQSRFADGSVALTENFRSVPGIIAWVNATFEGVFATTAFESVQARPMALVANRAELAGAGPVVATFGASSTDTAADLRSAEANDVAAIVNAAVGHWTVQDQRTRLPRLARLNDIALLLPTRSSLDAIDRAFDAADITARIESRSLVFATSEVRDLLSILEAINDPGDAISIVASLRSPGFACSDRALAQWSIAHGSWDYRSAPPHDIPSDHPVAAAMATLRMLHTVRQWRSVSDTVAAIIDTLYLEPLAVIHRRPRDRWRRIRFLLHHARVWDDVSGPSGLGGFVAWVREQSSEGASAVEVPVPEPDDDAVRVLTVHGSKGLEFPIVIFAGLGATPAVRQLPVLFTETGPRFRAGRAALPVASRGYEEAKSREAQHETAERARLLYVGATRARDHLVISRHHNERRATKSLAALLEPHFEVATSRHFSHTDLHPTLDPELAVGSNPEHNTATPHAVAPPLPALTTPRAIDDALATQRAILEGASNPAALSATGVAQWMRDTNDAGGDRDDQLGDDRAPWQRGRAGSALGRAVHGVLQFCDLVTGADVDHLATEQAAAEHIPTRVHEIAALVHSVRTSAVVTQAVAGRYWREVPVGATIDGVVIEGYIDLLFEADGQMVVVDYKTDHAPTDADIDRAVGRYAPQAATYALAVERALDRPVDAAIFVFARASVAIERVVDDLDAAKRQVVAALTTGSLTP